MESTQRNDDDHGDPEDESQFEDDDSGLEDDTNEQADPVHGLSIKDRTWHAKTYERCFVGQEAVDWMMANLNLKGREEAVIIGMGLMHRGIIKHVCNSEPFADHYFFYRFVEDERKKKRFSGQKEVKSEQLLSFTEEQIKELVTLMLSADKGLDIKNRKYHLRTYKDCFVGSEAVTWLLQKQKVIPLKTREEAVELGQLLIDRGVIHHVVNRQPFKDGYFFYRFYVHEEKYKKIEDTSKAKDILAYLQEGVEPEVEDDLAWAEKMVKLIEQLGLVTKDGRLPHAKLNSIWSNSLTNKEKKQAFLRILEKYMLSYRFNCRESLIPSLLPREMPSIVQKLWKNSKDEVKVGRCYKFKTPLPDSFFSKFIVGFLRFRIESILIQQFWTKGMLCIGPQSKALIRMEGNNEIHAQVCGLETARMISVFMEVVQAISDAQMGTPAVECYLVVKGKEQPHFPMPFVSKAIIDGNPGVGQNKYTVELTALAPDLMMLDFPLSSFSDFKNMKEIGRGSFAVVYKADFQGKPVAVKKFTEPEMLYEFRREVIIMGDLRGHKNIVPIVTLCNNPPAIVMEFIPFGTLKDFIREKKVEDWHMKLRIVADVAAGMLQMHSRKPKIIHKDLKAHNILIAASSAHADRVAVITDFGTARYLVSVLHCTEVQNPIYLAPEILAKEPFTERSDVYAFGIILYEILTGLEPFSEYGFAFEIADAVSAGKRPQIPSHFRLPIDAARLLHHCWAQDPAARLTTQQIHRTANYLLESLRDDPDKFLKAMPAWGALTEKCLSTPPRSTGPYMTEMDVLEDINPINDVQEVRKSELERNVNLNFILPRLGSSILRKTGVPAAASERNRASSTPEPPAHVSSLQNSGPAEKVPL